MPRAGIKVTIAAGFLAMYLAALIKKEKRERRKKEKREKEEREKRKRKKRGRKRGTPSLNLCMNCLPS